MNLALSAKASPQHKPYYAVPIHGNFRSPDLDQCPFLEPEAVGQSFDAYIAPLQHTHNVVIGSNARREFLNLSPLQQQLNTRLIMDYRDLKSAGYFAHPQQRLELFCDTEGFASAMMNNHIMLNQSDRCTPGVFSVLEIKHADPLHHEKSKRLFSLTIPHEEMHNSLLSQLPFNTTFKHKNGYTSLEDSSTLTLPKAFYILKQLTAAHINTKIDRADKAFHIKHIVAQVQKQHPEQDVLNATRQLLTPYFNEEAPEFFTTLMEANANLKLSQEGHDPVLQKALGLNTPAAYKQLVAQSSQRFTHEEKTLTMALVNVASQRVPGFAKVLQRQEKHWPALKQIMLQWGSKPKGI